jgi:molybdenum-dependent DNA-binding transcriptional regulator ModE
LRRYLQQTLRVRDLQIIHAVGMHGSILSAARALGLTQPAASKALRAAERIVGERLFERSSSGVRPTEAGALTLGVAARVLREVADLETVLSSVCGASWPAARNVRSNDVDSQVRSAGPEEKRESASLDMVRLGPTSDASRHLPIGQNTSLRNYLA